MLKKACADSARVEHEPIGYEYYPNRFFRCAAEKYTNDTNDVIDRHLDSVRTTLDAKSYVETGWPCYSHIPLYIRQFGKQVRIVHLTRHPLQVAASLTTHDFYSEDNDNGFNVYGTLNPFIDGTVLSGYRDRWNSMSRFEKCLYHWAEINLYGFWLRDNYPDTPFLRLKAEDLFADPRTNYRELMDFAHLTGSSTLPQVDQKVDKYSRKTRDRIDPELISRHPDVVSVMDSLSYYANDPTAGVSVHRYRKAGWLKSFFRKISGRQ